MSPISKTGIAQEIARLDRESARPRRLADVSPPASERVKVAPGFDFDRDLANRIARIAGDAPRRRQRLIDAFLESCVVRTFGAAAPSDPAFGRVIEQAREAIASDARLAAAMDRVLARWAGAGPP